MTIRLAGCFVFLNVYPDELHVPVVQHARKSKVRPYYDLVANIAAEEMGHIELVANTINLLLDQAEASTDGVTPPLTFSGMTGNPDHFLNFGLGAVPGGALAKDWGGGNDIEALVEEDMRRNVSESCVVLTNRGVFHGHEGVRQLAQLLAEELPEHRSFEYTYRAVAGRMAFLEWSYEDDSVRVRDGADSYLIEDGKIVAQTIHYTVEPRRVGASGSS